MPEPLVANVPELLRKHGSALVAALAVASIAVIVSASLWPETAKQLLPLRVMLATVLMVPAALLALALMPHDRAAYHKATPGLFRAWVAMWVAELVLCAMVLLLYVSPDAARFALSLPEWVLSGVDGVVALAWASWFIFGLVLVTELWHWARVRLARLVGRISQDEKDLDARHHRVGWQGHRGWEEASPPPPTRGDPPHG